MTKYMLLYWGSPTAQTEWKPSPEEMQQVFAQWQAWKDKFKAQVVDIGDGLQPRGKLLKQDGQLMDGPLPEAKEIVTGYSIIQAKSMEEAVKVAGECPIFAMPGATTEIRELMGY